MDFTTFPTLGVPGSYIPATQTNDDHVLSLLFQDHGAVSDFINASKPCSDCRQSAGDPMGSWHHQLEHFTGQNDTFTPLISPAMTPSYNVHTGQKSLSSSSSSSAMHELDFSPLSSPVINPYHHNREMSIQSTVSSDGCCGPLTPDKVYEQYEQLEQAKGAIARRLSALQQKQRSTSMAATHDPSFSFLGDALVVPYEDRTEPVTPASLMKLKRQASSQALRENELHTGGKSLKAPPPTPSFVTPPAYGDTKPVEAQPVSSQSTPRAPTSATYKKARSVEKHNRRELKPLLISPTLAPGLEGNPILQNAERILATQSNYQNMIEGKAAALGIAFSPNIHSGLEVRRTAHKAAEQKRRDSLKEWFDRLRQEVEDGYVMKKASLASQLLQEQQHEKSSSSSPTEEDGLGALKPLSKVLLLRYAFEYISELKDTVTQRDDKIRQLEEENAQLHDKKSNQ